MLLLGVISAIALPCIAFFDMYNFLPYHLFFAGTFFTACFFYIYLIADSMTKHKAEFPEDEWEAIDKSNKFRWFMCGCIIFFVFWKWFFPNSSMFFEWVLVFLYLNAIGRLNLTNAFYDTVHDGVPTKPQVQTIY